MRLLFISIEFTAATFSGNGVLAQSQVRALSRLGHEVAVLSGKPVRYDVEPRAEGAALLLETELPSWGELGLFCSWKEFSSGAASPGIVQAVEAFNPEVVLGVDWHSLGPYQTLFQELGARGSHLAPYVYMNYRVFLRTASGEEAVQLARLEQSALQHAVCATVLSRSDANCVADALPDAARSTPLHVLLPPLRHDMACLAMAAHAAQHDCVHASAAAPEAEAEVGADTSDGPTYSLLSGGAIVDDALSSPYGQQEQQPLCCPQPAPRPPHQRPSDGVPPPFPAAGSSASTVPGIDPGRGRYLLTCAVRISPEKEPHRFVDLAAELRRKGAFQRLGVVPLMFGAGWGSDYGRQLRQRVTVEVPECLVLDSFMGASQLAAVYALTLLNVHPCCYDAYGMTVVEAASQGAPSLVSQGGHVGATDLLDESSDEVLCADLTAPPAKLAAVVEALLGDRGALRQVGRAAARKARSWTEDANASRLVDLVRAALAKGASG